MSELDNSLLTIGQSHWTIRNAVEGVQIFGGIGSGKTSGSGRTLALKYLAAGFGGLVLTVKPEERADWEEYCALTNRSDDLVIITPDKQNYFNFLDYESKAKDGKISATTNILNVLKTVIRADEEKTSGRTNDPFWRDSQDMLIAMIIDLCLLAYGKVTIKMLYDITQTLPTKEGYLEGSAFAKAYNAAKENIETIIGDWIPTLPSAEGDRITATRTMLANAAAEVLPKARMLRMVDQFIHTLVTLPDKTRSTIEFSLTGFLFGLMREPIYSLFCGNESNILPEDSRQGKIILIDLPVKLYHKAGRDCQILFKYIWQRAMERGNALRPAFLWADEAQNFLHEHDPDFQATARSSMIATVYLTQNIPNYYANMGGDKAEYKVKSFLGTLATKIFHANADYETNKYASDLIGDRPYKEKSTTTSYSETKGDSVTDAMRIDKSVRPEDFGKLRTGGELLHGAVDAVIHFQSNLVGSKINHAKLEFDQNYEPQKNSQ